MGSKSRFGIIVILDGDGKRVVPFLVDPRAVTAALWDVMAVSVSATEPLAFYLFLNEPTEFGIHLVSLALIPRA